MNIVLAVLVFMAFVVAGLGVWRWNDARNDRAVWRGLAGLSRPSPVEFDPDMVAGLPEPARRFFLYAISPGAPLRRIVEIEMSGKLGLGTREAPNYKPMRARQILAASHGLVWRLKTGAISGSDGVNDETSWTRFWLLGLIPVVRAGGDEDHYRSAMGRVAAEAIFWTPAAMLPGASVRWTSRGGDAARAIIRIGNFDHVVDVTVAADGRPTAVVLQRWSSENPDKTYRLQPFGGKLSGFRDFDGYRLPTHVEAGNLFGTDGYFPFYTADVSAIRFLDGDETTRWV